MKANIENDVVVIIFERGDIRIQSKNKFNTPIYRYIPADTGPNSFYQNLTSTTLNNQHVLKE